MISQYKKDKPYKERLLEGLSALEKYPNKIPVRDLKLTFLVFDVLK